MIALKSDYYMSPEEYLEFEHNSDIKHEYIDGEVYAMAGTGGVHNIISGNLYMSLRNSLQGSACRTYFADVKVKLGQGQKFFYPDLVITCDQRDEPTLSYVNFPTVIIEVLSESTEQFDRGKKFQYYRNIPSLQEYILISSQEYLIECFRRTKNDLWTLQTYEGLNTILRIESLAIDAPLSEIYATLSFDPVSEIQPDNDRS
jgi:Uma2 family endonuclease